MAMLIHKINLFPFTFYEKCKETRILHVASVDINPREIQLCTRITPNMNRTIRYRLDKELKMHELMLLYDTVIYSHKRSVV